MKFEKDKELGRQIEAACEGLSYRSETDAAILPFYGGKAEDGVRETLLKELGTEGNITIVEREFKEFFAKATKIQKWYGVRERENARGFAGLRVLLEKNLSDLKMFRIGKIQIDIYAVGIDRKGNLAGIRTKAVET